MDPAAPHGILSGSLTDTTRRRRPDATRRGLDYDLAGVTNGLRTTA